MALERRMRHPKGCCAKTGVRGAVKMPGLVKRVKAKILRALTSKIHGSPKVHSVSPALSLLINNRVIDPLE